MVSFRQAFRTQGTEAQPRSFKVIVPVSGAETDARLLEIVERLAQRQAVNVTIVYVVEVSQSMPLDAELPQQIEKGESVLLDAERLATKCVESRKGTVRTELLQARSAGAAIVDEAIDRGADAIMLGATLRRKHGRVTVGDTVDYVMKYAPCEVFVIRHALPDWIAEHLEQA